MYVCVRHFRYANLRDISTQCVQGARLETRIFNSQISSKVRTIKVYDPMKIFDIVKLSRSNISLDLDTYIQN